MIRVDGGQKSGSGTIVRYALGLVALLGEQLQLTNISWPRQLFGLFEDSGTTTLAAPRSSKTKGKSVYRAHLVIILHHRSRYKVIEANTMEQSIRFFRY